MWNWQVTLKSSQSVYHFNQKTFKQAVQRSFCLGTDHNMGAVFILKHNYSFLKSSQITYTPGRMPSDKLHLYQQMADLSFPEGKKMKPSSMTSLNIPPTSKKKDKCYFLISLRQEVLRCVRRGRGYHPYGGTGLGSLLLLHLRWASNSSPQAWQQVCFPSELPHCCFSFFQ